jgi:5-methylcytosine-specific restriction protein A
MRRTGFPLSVRVLIIERANGVCELCGGAKPGMQVHHRRPRGMGGSRRDDTNTAANGIYCCADCHSTIESHRWLAQERGLLLRQHQEPTEVPVQLHGVRWFLTDDGKKVAA